MSNGHERTNRKAHSKHKVKAQRRKRKRGNPEPGNKKTRQHHNRYRGPQMTREEWVDANDKFRDAAKDGRRRMAIANGSESLPVRYSPSEVSVSDVGRLWEESEKNNKVKMFNRGKKLPKMSFSIELLDLDDRGNKSELQTIDKQIKVLKHLANSTRPVRILYTMFESGLWYITNLQLQSVRREPKTNMVVWAKVTVDLTSAEEEERNKLPTEKAAQDETPQTTPRTPKTKPTTTGTPAEPSIDLPLVDPKPKRTRGKGGRGRDVGVDDVSPRLGLGGGVGVGGNAGDGEHVVKKKKHKNKVGKGAGSGIGGAINPKSKKPRKKQKPIPPALPDWF